MLDILFKLKVRARGLFYALFLGKPFIKVGVNFKFFGTKNIEVGEGCAVGDNCWIEAVSAYKGKKYTPTISLKSGVLCSDSVHISAILKIVIGQDVLIGSHVYIGDHSHGSTGSHIDLNIPPAERELSDAEEIYIGDRVWLCDGVVILAGTFLADGCVVGANSVVKGVFKEPVLMAGAPAKIIRKFDDKKF